MAKAIKRLSGGKKALPAWRMKKMKQTPEEKANRELMMQLTGWAGIQISTLYYSLVFDIFFF